VIGSVTVTPPERIDEVAQAVAKVQPLWALLRVKAKPCKGRHHDRVKLLRGGKRIAGKRLNRKCVARFHPKIRSRSQFRARVAADKRHRAGKSALVTIDLGR